MKDGVIQHPALNREPAAHALPSGFADSTPEGTPSAPPPAVLAQIEDTQKRIEATDAKLDKATETIAALADQVRALTEAQRKSFWARLMGR